MLKKGTYVRITCTVLKSAERAPNLPEDTKEKPLQMWVKGVLNHDAHLGEEVEITTLTKRLVKGTLLSENQNYQVDYGTAVNELVPIGVYLREQLEV